MQIVIDIPEEVYRDMKECIEHGWYQGASAAEFIFRGVGKGIPLPKGHGRLIDAEQLMNYCQNQVDGHKYADCNVIARFPIVLNAEVENEVI